MRKFPIKLFIVLFPSFIIGLWAFIRSQFLSDYLSAEEGAMLAPILLLICALIFVWPLFRDMDAMERALLRATKKQVLFTERKNMAAKLHDSIAQSLFLMSVKIDQIKGVDELQQQQLASLQRLVEEVHGEVRTAIRDFSSGELAGPESESVNQLTEQFEAETGIKIEQVNHSEWIEWSSESNIAYQAFLKEGLFNIRKHAKPTRVQLVAEVVEHRLCVCLRDNGDEFDLRFERGFGLTILEDRLAELQWSLTLRRTGSWTELQMEKEVHRGRV